MSQKLPLAKREGALRAFLNRGRVMIADGMQAGVFGAFGAFTASRHRGTKKPANPQWRGCGAIGSAEVGRDRFESGEESGGESGGQKQKKR